MTAFAPLPEEQRPIWGVYDSDAGRFIATNLTLAVAEDEAMRHAEAAARGGLPDTSRFSVRLDREDNPLPSYDKIRRQTDNIRSWLLNARNIAWELPSMPAATEIDEAITKAIAVTKVLNDHALAMLNHTPLTEDEEYRNGNIAAHRYYEQFPGRVELAVETTPWDRGWNDGMRAHMTPQEAADGDRA